MTSSSLIAFFVLIALYTALITHRGEISLILTTAARFGMV
jgi:hypothetical protein